MSWTDDLTDADADADAEGDYDSDDVDHNDAGRDKSVVEAEWILYDDLTCTIESQVWSGRFTRYILALLLYASDIIQRGVAYSFDFKNVKRLYLSD
ncbi:hypothetical protein FRB98_008357 [Tulasnella sp. 332]|nr:hypothetical protein FRB98_008357 [Tulasnella sp. 332]